MIGRREKVWRFEEAEDRDSKTWRLEDLTVWQSNLGAAKSPMFSQGGTLFSRHPTPISVNNRCQVPAAQNFVEHMTNVIGLTNKQFIVAQQRQKFYVDKHKREVSFEVDQQMLVSMPTLSWRSQGSKVFTKVDWSISDSQEDRGCSIPRATAKYI